MNTPAPSIFQVTQYLLDLSFENFALESTVENPAIQINVNVDARSLGPAAADGQPVTGDYESILILNVTARAAQPDGAPDADAKPVFIAELRYAGRYRLANVPPLDLEPFLLIEAPRLLFPFARQVVADAVMQGGLPSLLLAPVDFAQIYEQQRRAAVI